MLYELHTDSHSERRHPQRVLHIMLCPHVSRSILTLFSDFLTRSTLSTLFFFFNDTATTEIYTLSLHDALPIYLREPPRVPGPQARSLVLELTQDLRPG